ncbi:MAG: KdsC family phosphatase [Armatimonadota bacterium]
MGHPEQVAAIKLLACDVDGVLTDGTICYGSGNLELKSFNIKDGLGIKLAGWSDLPVIFITRRSSDPVARRAAELGAQVLQGAQDKEASLRMVAASRNLLVEEIAFVGDDLNDLPALRIAGLPIAVADAVPEVLEIAQYVTKSGGGKGAIREVVEYILRGQGRWEAAVEHYLEQSRGGASHMLNPRVRSHE